MLTMPHLNVARLKNGILRIDRKFHVGMLLNVEKIDAPIVSIHPEAAVNEPIMDAVEIPVSELGYEALVVKTDRRGNPLPHEKQRVLGQLAKSRLMYGGGLGSTTMARQLGLPYVLILEYDLKTQITVTTSALTSRVRQAVRALRCAADYALTQVGDMRAARALHCNGYPTFDDAHLFNQHRLLYLDSRMSKSFVISQDALAARLADRGKGRPLRLLYSGRYERLKGADDAVRVGLECIKLGLSFELHCYGQGSLKPEMERLAAQATGGGKIVIHDAVPYPDLVELSRTFDVFVCCHIQSDPSCTYLESFGAGLPIVGYDNRMWKRLSHESGAGFHSAIGHPASVAKAIETLAKSSDLLESMSEKARLFALDHCFEREHERRTDAINEVLRNPRSVS